MSQSAQFALPQNAINTKSTRLTLNAMLALFVVFMVYYWSFTPLNQIAQDWLNSPSTLSNGLPNSSDITMIEGPETTIRLIGFIINFIFSAPIFYGFWLLHRLTALYGQGLLFTKAHVQVFKHVAWSFIAYGILLILSEPVMTYALTAFNTMSQKTISIGFGSSNLFPILTGIVMLPLVHVMQLAIKKSTINS